MLLDKLAGEFGETGKHRGIVAGAGPQERPKRPQGVRRNRPPRPVFGMLSFPPFGILAGLYKRRSVKNAGGYEGGEHLASPRGSSRIGHAGQIDQGFRSSALRVFAKRSHIRPGTCSQVGVIWQGQCQTGAGTSVALATACWFFRLLEHGIRFSDCRTGRLVEVRILARSNSSPIRFSAVWEMTREVLAVCAARAIGQTSNRSGSRPVPFRRAKTMPCRTVPAEPTHTPLRALAFRCRAELNCRPLCAFSLRSSSNCGAPG